MDENKKTRGKPQGIKTKDNGKSMRPEGRRIGPGEIKHASNRKTSAPKHESTQSLRSAVVMIVDDEPINIEVTQVYLEEAGYWQFASTSEPLEAMGLLATKRPDVLLLDLKMPKMSGFEILERMRTEDILKDVPTIVLTSATDAATKLKALEFGATDFLAKPVDPSELVLRVRNTLAAKAYRDRLANFDLLTGLPNRRSFMERLEWAIKHAVRSSIPGAVLHIDLDRFKQINEALGPKAGDHLLQAVARRVEQCLSSTGAVGRLGDAGSQPSLWSLGGDEFTILLPAIAQPESAAIVATRVVDAVAAPFKLDSQDIAVTCSIGIAVFPEDGKEADTVLRNAEIAMHHAKRRTRGTYLFYSSEQNARALHKLSISNELRAGLERDELRLFYQPKLDIKTSALLGAEALVCWQHPVRGLMEPSDFIGIAEESGLIVRLGRWVLHAACRQIKQWEGAGFTVPKIAVNVSSHQFHHEHLPQTIREVLEVTRVRPQSISIELTESVLIEDEQRNIEILQELKSMGIQLSLDDFGTGYSSLSYLNRFPIDELKIDRSFLAAIQNADDHSAVIVAIIAMAHSLGLRVVAEGVETVHQLNFLKRQNCDEFQGFLMSKPVPADAFAAAFLATRP